MANKLEAIEINGTTVWVEVEDQLTSGDGRRAFTAAGNRERGVDEAANQIARVDLNRTLKAIIEPVHAALKEAKPEEVSVELNLGLKGEVGIFVAKSEGNASLKITAKWKFT